MALWHFSDWMIPENSTTRCFYQILKYADGADVQTSVRLCGVYVSPFCISDLNNRLKVFLLHLERD